MAEMAAISFIILPVYLAFDIYFTTMVCSYANEGEFITKTRRQPPLKFSTMQVRSMPQPRSRTSHTLIDRPTQEM